MTPLLTASALLLAIQAAASATAPQAAAPVVVPALTLEQHTALKCGVAFALVAQQQKAGSAEGARYPAVADRGREFFVRTTAKIMHETGADRAAIGELTTRTVAGFAASEDSLPAIMPACLTLLDAAGL